MQITRWCARSLYALTVALAVPLVVYAAVTIPAACSTPGDCDEITPRFKTLTVKQSMSGEHLYVSGSSANPILMSNANGNVGIGTNAPSEVFHVLKASHGGPIVESQTGWPNFEMRAGSSVSDYRSRLEQSASNGVLQVRVGVGSAGVDGSDDAHLRISTTGNVGIGHLGTHGGDAPEALLVVDNTSGSAAARRVLTILGESGQTANLTEWQNNGGSPLSVVDASGNAGIGTSSPTEKLEVVGTISGSILNVNDLARLKPRSAAPSSPTLGDIYVDSDSNELCFYDGTSWTGLKAAGSCS